MSDRKSIALISPYSLERYGQLLLEGFQQLITEGLEAEVHHYFLNQSQSLSDFSTTVPPCDLVLLQLHGSHTEIPVAFERYPVKDNGRVALLLHRPEEILKRLERGLYGDLDVRGTFRRMSCLVLMGPAMCDDYKSFCSRVVSVPHGFFALDDVSTEKKAMRDVACVGAITTFSDMRWVSDVMKMHAKYSEISSNGQGKLLFYITGLFVPYRAYGSTVVVDELQCIRGCLETDPNYPVKIFEITEIEERLNHCTTIQHRSCLIIARSSHDILNSYKRWLMDQSDKGKKMIIVRGNTTSSQMKKIHFELIDFNLQLYRELMNDFKPKVEYSGSLHAAPGLSLPIVFDSPAMTDVLSEGLHTIPVRLAEFKPLNPNEDAKMASDNLWWPDYYYPDFTPAVQEMMRLQENEEEYEELRRKELDAARELTFKHFVTNIRQCYGEESCERDRCLCVLGESDPPAPYDMTQTDQACKPLTVQSIAESLSQFDPGIRIDLSARLSLILTVDVISTVLDMAREGKLASLVFCKKSGEKVFAPALQNQDYARVAESIPSRDRHELLRRVLSSREYRLQMAEWNIKCREIQEKMAVEMWNEGRVSTERYFISTETTISTDGRDSMQMLEELEGEMKTDWMDCLREQADKRRRELDNERESIQRATNTLKRECSDLSSLIQR
ncbi:hypothetical protein PROFUN_00470 [Planoprotostelium fungivorum]|uniref:Uncharacterized protein n=1 Tax=Planoprotostelium fungivorum TaxID=1890364 RepID=A0A2P6N0W5_9EUKA|nr:hypothetical protein PROFUN_00470 [Planoprotostelium fungivorum]